MTGIWDSIIGNAGAILQSLVAHEVRTTLAILTVLALDQLLRQWNPRLRYALWLVALFQALWPPTFHIPAFAVWPQSPIYLLPLSPETSSSSVLTSSGGINGTLWILVLWGTVSVLVILWLAVAFFGLRWKLRHAQPLTDPEVLAAAHISRRPLAVLVSHRIHSPLTIGLFRPRIYLTPAASQMDEHTRRAILHHEVAHILQMDRWVLFLQALALILHPFNPLVWLMNRRLARYREQICDDFALRHTDIAPVTYGYLLLNYVTEGALNRPALLPQTLFCESRNDFRQRLTQLLSRKETPMNHTTILQKISLGTVLLAVLFISSQCQEEDLAATKQAQYDQQAALTEAGYEFVPYDEPPEPVGGFGAIGKLLAYPEEAKAKGIEGMVMVNCQVLADGRTGQVTVAKNETGNQSLADAAVAAVSQITWIPARQRDRNVAVWIAIPINFSLDDKVSTDKAKD
ncbi:MAG: M56 family metallopeptidase [Fidelibacterota bacterium]|nr:MAG: M56 family metallopeptidase [Candidatus Neomarinimicrobiota bacterium]